MTHAERVIFSNVSVDEFRDLIQRFKDGEQNPTLKGIQVRFPTRIKQNVGFSLRAWDQTLVKSSKAYVRLYFDEKEKIYHIHAGKSQRHARAGESDAMIGINSVMPWDLDAHERNLKRMSTTWHSLPAAKKTEISRAKDARIVDEHGTTNAERRNAINREKHRLNIDGYRDRMLDRRRAEREKIRNEHDSKLYEQLMASSKNYRRAFDELFIVEKLSRSTDAEKENLRERIFSARFELHSFSNSELTPTGKFVKLVDLASREFDEVYCGFSRWNPETPPYRLEVANAVRYTYGRDVRSMLVLDVANDLPLFEAGGDDDSVEAYVQKHLKNVGCTCIHGDVYRTALGGSYTDEEKALRETLVKDGFEDDCAKRYIALKRAAETRGNIFVCCFPAGKGGWHGKPTRHPSRPGKTRIPPKVGIDVVRRNAHYDNVPSTSTRPQPRTRIAEN